MVSNKRDYKKQSSLDNKAINNYWNLPESQCMLVKYAGRGS